MHGVSSRRLDGLVWDIVKGSAFAIVLLVGLMAIMHNVFNALAGAPLEHAPMEQTIEPHR